MPKLTILKDFTYSERASIHSYVLRPSMGTVSHLPARVCEAAVEAGCAKFAEKTSPKKGKPT